MSSNKIFKNNRLEVLHKELDLVQNCINRMSNNSFIIKGWTITIVVAIITLITPNKSDFKIQIGISILITLCWLFDCYFLRLERLYRAKYQWLVVNRAEGASLKYLYDLNPYNQNMRLEDLSNCNFIRVLFSHTLFYYYGSVLIFVNLVYFYVFK